MMSSQNDFFSKFSPRGTGSQSLITTSTKQGFGRDDVLFLSFVVLETENSPSSLPKTLKTPGTP